MIVFVQDLQSQLRKLDENLAAERAKYVICLCYCLHLPLATQLGCRYLNVCNSVSLERSSETAAQTLQHVSEELEKSREEAGNYQMLMNEKQVRSG